MLALTVSNICIEWALKSWWHMSKETFEGLGEAHVSSLYLRLIRGVDFLLLFVFGCVCVCSQVWEQARMCHGCGYRNQRMTSDVNTHLHFVHGGSLVTHHCVLWASFWGFLCLPPTLLEKCWVYRHMLADWAVHGFQIQVLKLVQLSLSPRSYLPSPSVGEFLKR